MRDQAFRFILEDPNADSSRNIQRKRARLVTACDSCRAKKIKCVMAAGSASGEGLRCDACIQAATVCLFSDRDRYHAERGVSVSEKPRAMDPPSAATAQDPDAARRRKRRPSNPLSHNLEGSQPGGLDHSSSLNFAANGIRGGGQVQSNDLPMPLACGRGVLKRIIVPFFRYFGPTSKVLDYRKVKVRTLTRLDDAASTDSDAQVTASTLSRKASLPPSISTTPSQTTISTSITQSYPSSNIAPTSNNQRCDVSLSLDPNISGYLPAYPDGAAGVPMKSSDIIKNTEQTIDTSGLFDPKRPRYPSSELLPHLITLFFNRMACHFPFLKRESTIAKAKDGTLSAILANCICGVAARFSDMDRLLSRGSRGLAGEPYCDMAKSHLIHMLSWPSLEILQALILIAWAEFGCGRDSGLWMYSRMAVCMAMDLRLGSETTIQMTSNNEDRETLRLTWWAAVLIDRINSWGTGRPIAIADNQFDTTLPSCDPSVGEDFSRAPPASFVFGNLCHLVQLRGKMGDILNDLVNRNPPEYLMDMDLSELQSQMVNFYQSLPPSLVFNIRNFRRFSNHDQAATFLLMHLIFHSVIILLQRPGLLRGSTPNLALTLAGNVDLSRSSARSIVDMVILANEVDPDSLLANPFLDLPILTAARGFLAEREFVTNPPSFSSMILMLQLQWSESNLGKCEEILEKMSLFWEGVGVVRRILDQQGRGMFDLANGEALYLDSRTTHFRDVELMKQWATTAWRRQRLYGRRGASDNKGSRAHTSRNDSPAEPSFVSARPQLQSHSTGPPLLPFNHISAQCGETVMNGNPGLSPDASNNGMSVSEDPEGAALGITGFLDGALVYEDGRSLASGDDTSSQRGHFVLQNSHRHPSQTDPTMLRVSFNAAEADLSFGNHLPNEVFSIPEGFEEFLDSHASQLAGLPPSLADANGESVSDFSLQYKIRGQAEGFPISHSPSVERTEENAELDKDGTEREGTPKMFSRSIFSFASLGLPMGQSSLSMLSP